MHDEVSARMEGRARQRFPTCESKVGAMRFIHKHGQAATMQGCD
jgi:hypothetical protein